MASRLTTRQATKTRSAISATRICQRLQLHVEGKVEMSGTQVQAALGLLSYALPKPTQQVEQTGEIAVRWKS
jgi:hypothetical protein